MTDKRRELAALCGLPENATKAELWAAVSATLNAPKDSEITARAGGKPRVRASAAALASRHGVDLASVHATGEGGWITDADVSRQVAVPAWKTAQRMAQRLGLDVQAASPAEVANAFLSPELRAVAEAGGVLDRIDRGSGVGGAVTAVDVAAAVQAGRGRPPVPDAAASPAGLSEDQAADMLFRPATWEEADRRFAARQAEAAAVEAMSDEEIEARMYGARGGDDE